MLQERRLALSLSKGSDMMFKEEITTKNTKEHEDRRKFKIPFVKLRALRGKNILLSLIREHSHNSMIKFFSKVLDIT